MIGYYYCVVDNFDCVDGVDCYRLFLYYVVFGRMLDWNCLFGDYLEFVVLDGIVWFKCSGVVYCLVLCVGVLVEFGERGCRRCWIVGRIYYCIGVS